MLKVGSPYKKQLPPSGQLSNKLQIALQQKFNQYIDNSDSQEGFLSSSQDEIVFNSISDMSQSRISKIRTKKQSQSRPPMSSNRLKENDASNLKNQIKKQSKLI